LSPAQRVELAIFDVHGRLVRQMDSGSKTAGVHETRWDGRDNRGRPVASGVYYVRLTGPQQALTRKIVLLK
jgi:flagellar hook assembly protein FlgD